MCTSAHDDSITCPLEVSELENEPLENELSDTETKHPVSIYVVLFKENNSVNVRF